jgi:hypothetical protein
MEDSIVVQVQWDPIDPEATPSLPEVKAGGTSIGNVFLDTAIVPDKTVRMVPIQFHFHTTSEHARGGVLVCSDLFGTLMDALMTSSNRHEHCKIDCTKIKKIKIENCTKIAR